MPHGYQTARRRAVDESQNGHRAPTEIQITAAQNRMDDYWLEHVHSGNRLDSMSEREVIEDMLRAALNV